MMKSLRQVNVDHYHVGWYQSSDVGNFLSLPLLESQFHYQTSIEESVVLIFGKDLLSRNVIYIPKKNICKQFKCSSKLKIIFFLDSHIKIIFAREF